MMAPRKRSRDAHDVDGEVEIESATSSFRQNTSASKRPRVALARENGGSVVSDEEDDEVSGLMDEDAPGDATPTPYSDDEEDEIDELRATQIVQKQYRELKDNIASEEGVIEEVFCRNFMCHSKLRIKLGPLINFIIGHNGSGKSAVLTALTMCLGGKATATNRAASMKSLIKEGEESATLAVKIKNHGDSAYKPNLYGRSITVERNFTRAGTSGFKLKNDQDKIISTKRADLDDILDYFAFQLDNPINVLTQDMARQFLSNSSASDKYKFFIRGTQLEVLDADYKLMEEHLDSIEAKLDSRKQDIKILEQRKQEADRKKKSLEKTQQMRDKIAHLQWQHAWAQVGEQEEQLARFERQVLEAEQKVQERTEAAEVISGEYEGHNQTYETTQRQVQDLQEQLRPMTDNHSHEKEKFDKNKKELMELVPQERIIKESVKKSKSDIKKLEAMVKAEHDRIAGAEGAEHAERLAELERLKEAVEIKKQEQMEHGTRVADVERKRANAIEQLDIGKRPLDQRRKALDEAEGRHRALQRDQGQPFAAYRQGMQNLVRAIDAETRWRQKPVGPMGQHIRLLNQDWQSQLEKTFGGALESFIVTCKEDQALLSQIMKRVRCEPNVFIGNTTPLDTTGKEPREDVDTILRILEIDNPLVRNAVIINQAVEQTVLIPVRGEAEKFMYSNPRPHNVRVTMSFAHDRNQAIRFEYSGSGAPKSSNVPAWTGRFRMKSNHQDQVRRARDDVNQATHELETERENVRRLEMAVKAADEEKRRFERRQKDLRVQCQQAEDAVDQQNNEIERSRPQDGKLQELEHQLEEARAGLETEEASFQDMVIEKDKLNEIAHGIKAMLDAVTAELNQAKARVDKAEKRLERLDAIRFKALQEKNLALNLIDEAKHEITVHEARRDAQQTHVAQFMDAANRITHNRRIAVEDGLTPAVLDSRIDKFIKDMERAEREIGGTREELILAWQKARQEHAEAMAQVKSLDVFATVGCSNWSDRSAHLADDLDRS